MKRIDDHQTEYLWDEWGHLGPKRRRLLERDWPGLFRQYLFQQLPVEEIARAFHDRQGRPSKELYAISGAMILQVLFDLTDEQAVQAFCFDQRWHYALNLRGESDQDKYVCVRCLKDYRRRFIEYGLEQVLFERMTAKLIEVFRVDTSRQRLDSSHLKSAMRSLSRMQLFLEVIKKFLVELNRQAPEYYERVDRALRQTYEQGERSGCFAMKPSQSGKALGEVAQDLYTLVQFFKGCEKVEELRTYGHLCRVLRDQCKEIAVGLASEGGIEVKAHKEIKSDSLQNPSDEQSTYDKHKGVGYQVQLMETYQPVSKDAPEEVRGPDLITHVRVEAANRSDVQALPAALEESGCRGCKPEQVLADGGYGSYANWQKAEEQGVELVAPANKGSANPERCLGYSQFTYEADGQIRSCPAGYPPVKTARTPKGEFQTWFDREICLACPQRDKCLVKITKKQARLPNYTAKRAFLSAHRRYEQTKDFQDKYRWRAGIEATFSRLKYQLGADRLRVRGLRAMQVNVTLKALGMNILRCAKARRAGFIGLFVDLKAIRMLSGLPRLSLAA